jgi:tRNA(Leu) C34 or U34 (ribose-2'-O)-methylase TrmL
MSDVIVALIDPKIPHNVGGAVRAASIFCDNAEVLWTGNRVQGPMDDDGERLPREERMRAYRNVRMTHGWPVSTLDLRIGKGYTPVCVEVDHSAENLYDFVHPARVMYVFGPEDGSIPKGVRTICHRFVTIPTRSCLNLAAAVNVVLYDRNYKTARDTTFEVTE